LRISELCALDGGTATSRAIYLPRLRTRDDGRIVRVQGLKTEAAERVIPMLPAAHDRLLDHKTTFGFGPTDPVFATRNGRRNTVDNVRRRIIDAAVIRANELLVERGQRSMVACTPHTLRRTFASILADLDLAPRRAMYLIGHADQSLIMRVYQQVLDMATPALRRSRGSSVARSPTPFTIALWAWVCRPIVPRAKNGLPARRVE
jgi:integrase